MKGLLFFVIAFTILAIAWTKKKEIQEAFQAGAPIDTGELTIPLISPRRQTVTQGEVKPFAPPATELLAPPPGQSASVNSQPAEDPALEKAPAGRVQSVYESLTGFFVNEAPGLSELGDPSVQLPLSTARSDKARLEDELAVLKRNPGLQSSLTQEDVNGVEGNLAYLQKKWRLSVNAMSGSPMPPGGEGFSDYEQRRAAGGGWFSWFFGGDEEGFQSGGTGSTTTATRSDVKLKDLQDLSLKIGVEVVRLQSSGTTDLNTTARIGTLRTIQQTVDDLISDLQKGIRTEEDLPIRMADINKFLPVMTNLNTPLPQVVQESGASNILNSLFPKYSAGDVSGSEIAKLLFDQYSEDFLRNLSWEVNLKYVGRAEQDVAKNYSQAATDLKFTSESGGGTGNAGGPAPAGLAAGAYRGMFDNVVRDLTGITPTSVEVTRGGAAAAATNAAAPKGGPGGKGTAKPSPPGTFDWKTRATQICEQVSKRGLDPNDYGCMAKPDAVSDGFSWRGYARMVCTRLGTNYDPSVPELCGCPPPTWPGWRP